MGYCPECDTKIDEEFEDIGEVVVCPECGVTLEVVSLDPVEFDLAFPEDEEDDYEFDEGEEWEDMEDYEEYDEYEDDGDNGRY